MLPPTPSSTLFPYTTLFRSLPADGEQAKLVQIGISAAHDRDRRRRFDTQPSSRDPYSVKRLHGGKDAQVEAIARNAEMPQHLCCGNNSRGGGRFTLFAAGSRGKG